MKLILNPTSKVIHLQSYSTACCGTQNMNEMETVTDKADDKFRKEYLDKGYRLCGHCKKKENTEALTIKNKDLLGVLG